MQKGLGCDLVTCAPESLGRNQPPPLDTLLSLPEPVPAERQGCGRRHRKRSFLRPRIIGGSSSLPGSHPWLAAIYIGNNFCSGSLVHTCWVVSAAHCFSNRWVAPNPVHDPFAVPQPMSSPTIYASTYPLAGHTPAIYSMSFHSTSATHPPAHPPSPTHHSIRVHPASRPHPPAHLPGLAHL